MRRLVVPAWRRQLLRTSEPAETVDNHRSVYNSPSASESSLRHGSPQVQGAEQTDDRRRKTEAQERR
ncbi:MAG: hypothetical protein ACR2P2_17430, partial [Nakamurella sp.]